MHITNNQNGEFETAHSRNGEISFISDRFTNLSRSPTFKKVGI